MKVPCYRGCGKMAIVTSKRVDMARVSCTTCLKENHDRLNASYKTKLQKLAEG